VATVQERQLPGRGPRARTGGRCCGSAVRALAPSALARSPPGIDVGSVPRLLPPH